VVLNLTLFRLEVVHDHAQDIFRWISNGRLLLGVKLVYLLCLRIFLKINKKFLFSKCLGKCGIGFKNRSVFCWNTLERKESLSESYCNPNEKPISSLPCMNASCGYGWFVSTWSPV
jgi:hypothetical protein